MHIIHRRAFLYGCLAIALAAMSRSATGQPLTFTYAEIGGQPMLLDFYPPTAGNGRAPLIIWIHGGGWQNNTRAITGHSLRLRNDGFAVASIDYRLTSEAGQWGDESVSWPAQAHDIKAAVRWLRANAGMLGVNPCAFISWGASAGGHLSAILGTSNGNPELEGSLGEYLGVSSDVQLAVDYFGPTDLLYMNPDITDPPGSIVDHDAIDSGESLLLGSDVTGISVGEIRDHINDPNEPWVSLNNLASSAAPAQLAAHAPSNVPFFISHGDQDPIVPLNQSNRLLDALHSTGLTAELLPVPGAGHNLPTSVTDDHLLPWLEQQLALLPTCTCPADLTNNGILNFFDISAFLTAFASQDPIADFSPDGVFDFFDISNFLTAFSAGCP